MEIIFEWDQPKARENLPKHKISFDEAKTIFNDPLLLTFRDEEHSDDEERYISIGLSVDNQILLVVHTERELDKDVLIIRIISSRRGTASERKVYEEGGS